MTHTDCDQCQEKNTSNGSTRKQENHFYCWLWSSFLEFMSWDLPEKVGLLLTPVP